MDTTYSVGQPVEGGIVLPATVNAALAHVQVDHLVGHRHDQQVRPHGAAVDREVMPPAPGSDAFRFSDPYRRTIRIHTKHVGTEAAAP